MSTEINIKKRIDIQEEGVSITPDVNSINFIGDGVTASAIGDDVTVNIPGGTGTVTYYLNESVTQAPYKEFTSILTASPEQTIVTSIASGATVTIQSFQTPSGVPGTTNIPGGRWAFYLHFSGTTGDSWDVFADVYKRDLGGIETLLLTTDAVPTSTLTGVAVMLLTDGVFPTSTVLTTDRILVKVRVTNTDSTTNSITFHTEGNTNYSVATTTLNQVIPTGAVTSVTGTAPIASSGGTTPAISISQSGAASDGYLSSTDWNTFNNKVDDNIYTADGTLGGNRTVTMNTNTITFDGTDSNVKYTPNSAGGYLQLEGKASAVPRFSVSIPPYLAQPVAGFQLGMRAWDDAAFPGYGKVGDAFFYAGNATNGLNFLNPVGVGTEDYIRFYAGELATATSHIHIQGTGATKGNVGIGTETPTEKLDVAGKTKTTTFQLTTAPTAGYVLTSDASGNGTWSPASSGGLTYFTEAQSTAAPNATVPVDSLTAVSATTDADFAIVPKGNGAIIAAVPNNLTSGGNKRGQYAVDWQMLRNANTRVASGNRSVIIGGYNNGATNTYSIVGGESNQSLGYGSVVFGTNNSAFDTTGVAIGNGNNINGQSSVGLGETNTIAAGRNYAFAAGGLNSITSAGQYQTALGYFNTVSNNVSVGIGFQNTASGSAAVALGQQTTASGTNSTSGGYLTLASGTQSVAIGGAFTTASGIQAVALGANVIASGTGAVALGSNNTQATGDYSFAAGYNNFATAQGSFALGIGSTASGFRSGVMGSDGRTFGISARLVWSGQQQGTPGDTQKSTFILQKRTTGNTATTLTSDPSAASTTNQVILSNQSAYRFKGSIVGKQSGSVNAAVWDIDGFIVRGANAAATTLNISNVTLVQNTPAWGTPTLAADTTNGGLQVQVTGAAATNIQWTCTIETTEVIYA